MFKLLLLFFLSVVIQAQNDESDDWYYEMGDDWEVSDRLSSVSPYYGWYKEAAQQMGMYGYAKHVGKINRGQLFNPELNMPADRAFGYQSDFNPEDFNSGAFKHKPQGQKYRAKSVHVNEGLASYVGEVRTMPIGQHVQEDGTVLVQTPYRGDPCRPNPCTNVRMSTCTAVNKFTAKCSRSKNYKLTLTWFNPPETNYNNDLTLRMVAAHHDGSLCAALDDGDDLNFDDEYDEDCGVIFSEGDNNNWNDVINIGEEYATLTTLADGTMYQQYSFAVFVSKDINYNLSEGGPTLTVEYDGVAKQTLAIPQYRVATPPTGANINFDERFYYFFGCFRPQYGFVDTRGAGFYASGTVVFAGLDIFDAGLCKELLSWRGGTGFNPYVQTGSGDETYTT